MFNMFKSRNKKTFVVTEKDPLYKVKYLGNVHTTLMKGDGCVDKPTGVLWGNYLRSDRPGMSMKLTVSASGLKAYTKEHGYTDYRAHRISYCIAHPNYPKLFVWVYRHEGKKMKVELRCHAVLCRSDANAKAIAVQLAEKLSYALLEFRRQKTRQQNTRLMMQKTQSLPGQGSSGSILQGVPLRKKLLSPGQNFRPSSDQSSSAPKLGSITEDGEGETLEEVEEEEEEVYLKQNGHATEDGDDDSLDPADIWSSPGVLEINHNNLVDDLSDTFMDFEIGNDVEELKRDKQVQYVLAERRGSDSDDDSSTSSGVSEQEQKELKQRTSLNGTLKVTGT